MQKRLLCRFGFHRWVATVTAGEPYLACRYCKKYGGSPSSGPFTYAGKR